MEIEIDNKYVIITITTDELEGNEKLPDELYNALELGRYFEIKDEIVYPHSIEYKKRIPIEKFIEIMKGGNLGMWTYTPDENDNI